MSERLYGKIVAMRIAINNIRRREFKKMVIRYEYVMKMLNMIRNMINSIFDELYANKLEGYDVSNIESVMTVIRDTVNTFYDKWLSYKEYAVLSGEEITELKNMLDYIYNLSLKIRVSSY
jgi:hypothetical protein